MLINRTLRATALLIVLTSSACGLDGDGSGLFGDGSGNARITVDALADVQISPSVPTRVGSVQAVPSIVTVPQGNVAIFTAVALDTAGRYLSNVSLQWQMRDQRAGTITVGGVFTAGTQQGVYQRAIEVTAVQTVGDREFKGRPQLWW
ncbi:MAG: hypothetical protein O2812_00995 [Chloroflexi bacterium]|nr:hypothetical protein [Chloroflexota bacterium]